MRKTSAQFNESLNDTLLTAVSAHALSALLDCGSGRKDPPQALTSADASAPQGNEILSTLKAAEFLGIISAGTLERWRYEGRGPAFVKLGRNVGYRLRDLIDFRDQALCSSTAEAKKRALNRAQHQSAGTAPPAIASNDPSGLSKDAASEWRRARRPQS